MNKIMQNLKTEIEQAQHIALILHVSPDGDTCGTSLALRRAFLMLGKEVAVLCDDQVPRNCSSLYDANAITSGSAYFDTVFDLVIAVDVSEPSRMGNCAKVFAKAKRTAQIDHHSTNPQFAQINYVRFPVSATAVLALEVIDALAIPLDDILAECLYTAVASDTGNFRHQNTDALAMRVAARCLDEGVEAEAIGRRLFFVKPYAQQLLLGKALQSMQRFENERIAIMRLSRDDFRWAGALSEHTEGIVNYGIDTEGVQMACLLTENETCVKCSLRSFTPFDVAKVAVQFGGGGHTQAAGCTLSEPLTEACQLLQQALAEEWRRSQSMDS